MFNKMVLLSRFRKVAIAEGISFLVLLLIAMPLKYGLGMDWAVKAVGWAHGLLFMAYVWYLFRCWMSFRWTWVFAGMGLFASLVPCGPFVFDRCLPSMKQETVA